MMETKQPSMTIPPTIVLIIKYKAGFKLRHQDTNLCGKTRLQFAAVDKI